MYRSGIEMKYFMDSAGLLLKFKMYQILKENTVDLGFRL